MNAAEARACIDRIKGVRDRAQQIVADAVARAEGTLLDARPYFAQLLLRGGWQALNYPSFVACVEAELGVSERHAYRIQAAANERQELSTTDPGSVTNIPERQLRELAAVKDPVVKKAILSAATRDGTRKTSASSLKVHTDRYKNASTAEEKIAALKASKQELGQRAERSKAKKQLGHAGLAAKFIADCIRWYGQIRKTAKRARRHAGIASGDFRDGAVERHLTQAAEACERKIVELSESLNGAG